MNKNVIPVVALRGMTLLPGTMVHFEVRRKKSVNAVNEAMSGKQELFLVTQKDPDVVEPGQNDLYTVGVIANIKQFMKASHDTLRVVVETVECAFTGRIVDEYDCLYAEPEELKVDKDGYDEYMLKGMGRVIKDMINKYSFYNPKFSKESVEQLCNIKDIYELVMQTANSVPMDYETKQELISCDSLIGQYEIVVAWLRDETEIINVTQELKAKVKAAVDKNQRDYVMREQIRVLRKELGDDTTDDSDVFEEKVKELNANESVKEKIRKEIGRYRNIGMNNSEGNVVRGYIESLLELPWENASEDNNDIAHARKILGEDHYGLEKIKERIIEFLAVRAFSDESDQSTIICLVGPPGTGKTSIAKSVARALNKNYQRICLGGVRDEAEIRGHRKTYVGAMPGRIIKALQSAKVKNPLILLDEIDKMASDYKGDPAAAMLEVLDSEQNGHFVDHYIEIPVDLSEAMFIATANSVDTIPRPLLDRMEVIEVTGYTHNEKMHIAKEHLIVKQIKKHGLTRRQFGINDNVLSTLISGYTREAGVRNLERNIASLCRKAVTELVENDKKSVRITEKNLKKYLGRIKYIPDMKNETDQVGIVRGLAWTSVGGDTLEIEVNSMPGKGEVRLTGKLGDVMKESAMTALSFVRSVASDYKVDKRFFEKNDLHIHVPEGAVPKDGPSAGVTIATAILSAATNIPVRADVAMTGEITLRGRVLPIGGLKEKLLAAKTAGIRMVFVPDKNRPDVEEISEEIKKGMDIVFVENVTQIIKEALTENQPEKKQKK